MEQLRKCESCKKDTKHEMVEWTNEPQSYKYTCNECKHEVIYNVITLDCKNRRKRIEITEEQETMGMIVKPKKEGHIATIRPVKDNEKALGIAVQTFGESKITKPNDLTPEEKFTLSVEAIEEEPLEFNNEHSNIYIGGSGKMHFGDSKTGYKADMTIYKNTRSQMDDIYTRFREEKQDDMFKYVSGRLQPVFIHEDERKMSGQNLANGTKNAEKTALDERIFN